MKYLLALILALISFGCFAAIYMQRDSNGDLIYSDTPGSNAKAIALPNNNTTISLPQKNNTPSVNSTIETTTTETATASSQDQGSKGYNSFIMTDPTDQETFQNQQDIPVTIKIEPDLRPGDKVQLYLDSKPIGSPSSDLKQLMVHQADRGEHQLSAAIIDSNGVVLDEMPAITLFIHYSAIPTGSGAISPVQTGGVSPSSPGSGITPPASQGSGITAPGNGITPSGGGNGITPPASQGSGITPSVKIGPTP